MAHERNCIVCRKEYKYCSHCDKYPKNELWRYLYCSEDCKEIYGIYEEYKENKITDDAAKSLFSQHDLSRIALFNPLVKELVEKAMNTKTIVEEKVDTNESTFIPKMRTRKRK